MAMMIVGCAQNPRMPVDVAVIPDDCANRERIIRWLDQLAQSPKQPFQSAEEHANVVSQIKNRIWRIRYNCQRV